MLTAAGAWAQQAAGAHPEGEKYTVKAAKSVKLLHCNLLIDGTSAPPREKVIIVVEDDRIGAVLSVPAQIGSRAEQQNIALDTCLPGLMDTHTHVLLQGDITAEDYDKQLLKWSPEYRTILGTQAARQALMNGFTTLRDLETEGAGYADVDIKRAIERGIIPGPRMQVATRALDVTGAYPLQGYAPGVAVPHGVQLCDGPDECRKAVREQISHGADWVKVYVDRSYFVRPDGVLDDIPTFTLDELRAIVDEAHREHHKVAAHAAALHGVHNAVEAGVDSIEHGMYIAPEDMKTMVAKGIFYVPTLYVGEYVAEGRAAAGAPVWKQMVAIHADTFQRAVKAGVKIAFGTDAGGFDWGINEAIEFPLMVKYGMTPAQAIRAATAGAAELLGMDKELGTIEPGKLADIVAVDGNALDDVGSLQKINFVMKGGVVVKQ
jgi:imidazolonepropionase-like amidohydrolase